MSKVLSLPRIWIVSAVKWCRVNLFATWYSSLATLFLLYLFLPILWNLMQWAVVMAQWQGQTRQACSSRDGACWVFVIVHIKLFIYGMYPSAQLWRVNTVYGLFLAQLVCLMWPDFPGKKALGVVILTVFPVICFVLLHGGMLGLTLVETDLWSGLLLSLIIAFLTIEFSLPMGLLLALGRRSGMPIVKACSVIYIELFRAVPLITILFMSSVMFPIFLHESYHIDKLLRAIIGIILFMSSYMAEAIRGGLQAVPKDQYDAANSLGFSYYQQQRLIILPQALKIAIPALINTSVAIIKDTSLVLIIGLYDLLGIVKSALSNSSWLGFSIEGYVFAGFVFWMMCFSLSRYSQYIERKYRIPGYLE